MSGIEDAKNAAMEDRRIALIEFDSSIAATPATASVLAGNHSYGAVHYKRAITRGFTLPHAKRNTTLIVAATLSALAAALHLGCIVFGAPWYRFFGAGEQRAQLAIAGHWLPPVLTLAIAVVLMIWSLYALSGAGVLRRLPLLRTVLCGVTAVYLLRGVAVLAVMELFPGRSPKFW